MRRLFPRPALLASGAVHAAQALPASFEFNRILITASAPERDGARSRVAHGLQEERSRRAGHPAAAHQGDGGWRGAGHVAAHRRDGRLAQDGASAFHLEPGTVMGASFITKAVFDQWRSKHRVWQIADRGESMQGHRLPMIDVPRVDVGGFAVEPVRFVARHDRNSSEGLSPAMDKPVAGAFGASGLHHVHLVLDHPRATARIRPN